MAAEPKTAAANGGRKFNPAQPWAVANSLDLYHVQAWGKGYFGINDAGHVVVRPDTTAGREIDLFEVVEGLRARDLTAPVVVRFSDILAHRLRRLHDAFAQAITENDYKNRYAAVFPIKVNQQRLVVEEVYRYGKEFGFGLEVGSKPELLAVMAMTENAPERLIICNGFKDDSYIEAVTLATKLGRTIIPVVENFEELGLILKHAQAYGVRPRLGVRVKLFSEGSGRWSASAGEKSKFGLFITEILELFSVLKAHDMLDCLQLVHCHPGSQLQDIRRVKDAINELAHVYAELKLMGAGLQYIDVGGGLGVDYDGSGTNFSSSMNYTLTEYASDVVYRVASVCNARDIPHPMIVSESGRAIAAYHSVLVFDTLGSSALDKFRVSGDPALDYQGSEELPQPVRDLFDAYRTVSERRLVECYHDALTAREQVLQMFNLGLLSLEFRGLAERLYWATCAKIRDSCRKLERLPEELEDLESILSDTYSATSRCSSRCRTAGRSSSCSRSCRSIAWKSARRAPGCWRTSPATPTARSIASCHCATSSARSSCTSSSPARSTTWRRSWWAPTRRPSATCTTCSATRTSCTCACTMKAAGGSRRSSRATPPTRCWSTWSTTWPSSTRRWRATASVPSVTVA